jgi:uncharacterized repeat protein (TIGR02543 family)
MLAALRGRGASFGIHRACIGAILAALTLGSCRLALQPGSDLRYGLKLAFLVQGRSSAAILPSVAGGARLLLPTAQNLTVTVTPLDAGLDTPAPQIIPIDTSKTMAQTVPVTFPKLAGGRYKIEAVAKDGGGEPLFQQSLSEFDLPSGSNRVVLNLVPVDSTGLPGLQNSQLQDGTLAAGGVMTWKIPSGALSAEADFSFSLVTDPSVLLFAQYADGVLIDPRTNLRAFIKPSPASGESFADSFVTLYNPGSTSFTYRFIYNPVLVIYDGNNQSGQPDASGTLPETLGYVKDEIFAVAGPGDLAKTGYVFVGWKDDTGTDVFPGDTVTIAPSVSTILVLHAQWVLGSALRVSVDFANPTQPAITFTGSPSITKAESLSLDATNGFDTYSWSINGTPIPAADNAPSFTVSGSDVHLQLDQNSILLVVGKGGEFYSAQFPFTLTN